MIYKRTCPKCNKILTYINKKSFSYAKRKNSLCISCGLKGHAVCGIKGKTWEEYLSNETIVRLKKHLSEINFSKKKGPLNPNYGGKVNLGKKRPHSKSNAEKFWTSERREKMSDFFKEWNRIHEPWSKGKTKFTDERIMKMSERQKTDSEWRDKWILNLKKASRTRYVHGHKVFCPNYNRKACEIFEEINKQYGLNGQHAENNGEFFIEELDNWLDFYDEDKNIVIEYYERNHFNADGTLNNKTLIREQKIIDKLDCNFFRINAFDETNIEIESITNRGLLLIDI